ncbi:MAG: hypothetical protein IPK28_05675 [Devosia sp.]|nr:hypothetical protein [Devosia sp.]
MRSLAAAVLSLLAAAPSGAAEMIDSVFETTFTYGGVDQRLEGSRVPLVPGACYTWWIRLAEGATPTTGLERLILPAAPSDWGDAASNPEDGIDISEDGRLATSTFVPELDDGWISNGWCVADGDPTGPHRIEVAIDGIEVTAYDFEVVLPEDYAWPALPQPDPRERSVDRSW